MEHFWIDAAGLPAEITAQQALTPLFRQTYHRDDPALEYLTLGFLDALLRRVPVYPADLRHDGRGRPLQL